ncbi:MAG: hypothetical protein AUJ23_00020 [Candidatus Magasanikbacteria bacterium CG1_02_32_51]|uniref:Tryptophan synthase beta chain-like PALP domain-containing protein n=2 Tax=Candidatus Magasanikiibacteriota TaxID=1752731 RepID=A0A1J4UCQ6_9BACT|nr:MAG: hypothetical protein AUJ23_00020 [Candidatus Magasanikbacteria bacterium CG1_02_32_51]
MKTPQQSYLELNNALGIDIYLKREDEHKYSSHKGRSIPIMIKKYFKEEGITNFVISSSGNAAIATIHTIQAHNKNNKEQLTLQVFVGQNIDKQKLKILYAIIEDKNISIEQVARPKQQAFQMEKEGKTKNLRQSTDDIALVGYIELAEELNNIPNLQAIFIPTSSGTTAQALGLSFENISTSKWGGKQNPQIHIVQTTSCHPMAKNFDKDFIETKTSLASAIVDNIAHRKEKVLEVIKKSNGSGWVITDEELKNAINLVEETCKLKISHNSALSIAGLIKAMKNGWKFDGVVVCLITGM